ncbi:phosphatase PAP2 family protein [Pedobacter frigoris]|uniref:Phosphatase PAP2 family protein n=1 Tax=Pedobacter frigoris TaxID=2571272 RepID=A0A4U1CBH0_9SPHI|nr:phosphatase PAP2 family protein [Pedobacter frigoris]TKC03913.1 phosphatase PAP2 family protein [Pedobacter frigoris]
MHSPRNSGKVLRRLLTLILALVSPGLHAQIADSIQPLPAKGFWKSELVKKSTVPAILLGSTALVWSKREDIREVRNRYIPTFRYHYDDYLQYAPAATVIALNSLGIKGKHSPARTFVSYAFSIGIMGAMVNGIKYTSKVQRPDAASKNSFPSGHTASAFMNATVLHKEYGQYRHELYSVAGYGMATATALGRGLNNRHWVTDVLAGAAVGIVSTELGYLLAEQIFRGHEINAPLRNNPIPIGNNPSFVEIHLGYAMTTSKDPASEAKGLFTTRGFNFGLEGAWFMNKNFGIGGEFAFSGFPVNSDNIVLDPEISEISTGNYTQAFGVRYLHGGPYFSLPLPHNWFVTGKITGGVSTGSTGNVVLLLDEQHEAEFGVSELPYIKYQPQPTPSFSIGGGIQKRIGRNTAIKAYSTYFLSSHNFEISKLQDIDNDGHFTYEAMPDDYFKLKLSHITFGLGLTAFIW